ncbi:Thymidine phosphorylase [Hypsibius exemplaris]|uniref:Thymidine phosphorylase n=1 Tax=Hypsibius exemplaris TaxID=2072580 RepID=A0A1W0X3Z5_HYPEX|nr:Thymidine phosphorylase [Hypsibius exemplaris]
MNLQKFKVSDILAKKRDGGVLTEEEIDFFVGGLTTGAIQDVQTGALLMAIYLKGMTDLETATLTKAMLHSGKIFQWPDDIRNLIVDKHSTGGVGDKISLILGPALAACGLKVPMISGRGLGFTGGTIDKLESIPGFRVLLSQQEAMSAIENVGCFIMAQTADIVPADKILYASRDVTATVDCPPLITASILSKKASESLSALLLDLKCGSAAFIQDLATAQSFARLMVKVGTELGIKTAVAITRMDCPLGRKIGNALEVEESLDTLKGRGPSDIEELVVIEGGILLHIAGIVSCRSDGEERIRGSLYDGTALRTFRDMMTAQGVAPEIAASLCCTDDSTYGALPKARRTTDLRYSGPGDYVHAIDALVLALVSGELGAARTVIGGPVNHAVGLEVLTPPGSKISAGTPWIRVYHDEGQLSESHADRLQSALTVHDSKNEAKNGRNCSQILEVIY